MKLFFNKSATAYRLTNDVGSTIKESYVANGTVKGALMNAQPADSMLSEGNPSKSFVWFCETSADLKDSDKLTIDGVSYIIKGVVNTAGIGLNLSYKKAMIERLNS